VKRIAVTTAFVAVAVASAAAQASDAFASSTLRGLPVASSYQIVVQARLVGMLVAT
jgi:hypothetical protein